VALDEKAATLMMQLPYDLNLLQVQQTSYAGVVYQIHPNGMVVDVTNGNKVVASTGGYNALVNYLSRLHSPWTTYKLGSRVFKIQDNTGRVVDAKEQEIAPSGGLDALVEKTGLQKVLIYGNYYYVWGDGSSETLDGKIMRESGGR